MKKTFFINFLITALLINSTVLFSDECNPHSSFTLDQSAQNICQVVINSELCEDVPKEDRINCTIVENSTESSTWNYIKGCVKGAFNSVKEILAFIWDVLKWVWSNTTSSNSR